MRRKLLIRPSVHSPTTLLAAAAATLALSWENSYSEGFRNPPEGAFGLGRAGGRIAQVDDSSAVIHNPANLVDLAQPEALLTPTIADLEWTFTSKSAPGQKAETKDTWKLLPDLFASVPIQNGKIAFGLGLTTPYGMASEWDTGTSAFARPSGVLRYQSPYSAQLTTINANPSVAVRIGDHLQLGAGLDVMWSELSLKQYYPWFLATSNLSSPDGKVRAEGDGVGYGGNLGVTVELAKRHRIAVTYRSPISVSYEGHFDLDNVPIAFGGGTMHRDFKSKIKFPTIVAAGYGVQLSDKVRLETDVEWLQFSNFGELPITVNSGPPGLPSAAPERWKDTFTWGIAGDWQFMPNWVLRAGYQFYQSPIPDSTLSPTLIDSDQNAITVGVGYRYKQHSFEVAYSRVLYADRHINQSYNAAFNGDYEVTLNLFALAYRFAF